MMKTLSRRLRKLEEIQAEQEEEEGPSIAEILRAGRWPGREGGQASPSLTTVGTQPRTPAEIIRYRRQMRLAQAEQRNECSQTE
jgi:hypothetical protein